MHREVFPDWCEPPVELAAMPVPCVDIWRIALTVPGSNAPVTGQRAFAQQAMRQILGRYIGCPAEQLPIATRTDGKPYLDMPGEPIEFNLSHSREMALLAVSRSFAVGVDVETYRELADPLRLARRALIEADVEELVATPEDRRMARFFHLWTLMEARQKALGRGIFARPAEPSSASSFSFRPGTRQFAGLSAIPPTPAPELRFFYYRQS